MEKTPLIDTQVKWIRIWIKKAIPKTRGIEWDATKDQLPEKDFVNNLEILVSERENLFENDDDLLSTINCILVFCKQNSDLEDADYWARYYFYVVNSRFGVFSIQMADILAKQSLLFLQQGELALSEEYAEQALTLRGMLLPKDHPDFLNSLTHSAAIHQAKGDKQKALILYGTVLRRKITVYGNRSVEVAKTCKDLAELYTDIDEGIAEELFKEALLIFRQHFGDRITVNYGITLKNLAVLYVKQERYIEAEHLFKQAIRGFREQLTEKDTRISLALMEFADCYMKQERYPEAQNLLEQARRLFEDASGDDSIFTALCRSNLGKCLKKQERHTEADKLLKQSDTFFQNKLKATNKAREQVLKELLEQTSNDNKDTIKRMFIGQEVSKNSEELESFYLDHPETRYSYAQALAKIVELEMNKESRTRDTDNQQNL
jgi:tetratricopeptide (TPR) repeat protein